MRKKSGHPITFTARRRSGDNEASGTAFCVVPTVLVLPRQEFSNLLEGEALLIQKHTLQNAAGDEAR